LTQPAERVRAAGARGGTLAQLLRPRRAAAPRAPSAALVSRCIQEATCVGRRAVDVRGVVAVVRTGMARLAVLCPCRGCIVN